MKERRNSDRIKLQTLNVKEANGDYFFSFRGLNLSEEGIFLESKFCANNQEPFSKLSFRLPNGKHIQNITARMVREERRGKTAGAAFEFMNLSEEARLELKRFFVDTLLRGTA